MKLLFHAILSLLIIKTTFSQQIPQIEVRSLEYVWERPSGDKRIVFAKDSMYQQVLKRSFIKAIANKWNVGVPDFDIMVNKLPALRMQPKFNTTAPVNDSSKRFIFLQLFDQSIAINPNNSLYSARINVRFRMIRGIDGKIEGDKTTMYNIIPVTASPGQVLIRRYSFHESAFEALCDTISATILDDHTEFEHEVRLAGACAYTEQQTSSAFNAAKFQFDSRKQSYSVGGQNAFTIIHDSASIKQTGKKRHGGANTAGGLLTLFSNIDTEKKRSDIMLADHSFTEGINNYHALISYLDVRLAERRRVKDDEGFKSVEVGNYEHDRREIKSDAQHFIIINSDTVSRFVMRFRTEEEHFNKIWNGKDSNTIDSLPAAFNNLPKVEMDLIGTIGIDKFILTTSDGGANKMIKLNEKEVFRLNRKAGEEGEIIYRNLDDKQVKIAMLLCIISDKYY
jgi:hypothetical protein